MTPKILDLKPGKILIRSTNWIGDAIMTTPAVRSIRQNFPESEITLLALPWVADVFGSSAYIDKIFLYNKFDEHKGIKGRLKLARQLADLHFDLTLLLQNAFEAALITTMARIPIRAGYSTDGRGLLLTHPVSLQKKVKKIHQVHYYQKMLEGLGLHSGSDELYLNLSKTTREKAAIFFQTLREDDPKTGCVVGLNPGASYGPAKRWPAGKFGSIAAKVANEMSGKLIVFGTEADRKAAEVIEENAPGKVLDMTGKTSLAEAMGLIENCDVFVTNDSGLMHVSAALKTPTVAIFGSTNPVTTGPYSKNSTIIRKEISCSPCMKTHCNSDFRCMHEISIDEVFDAVQSFISYRKL